MRRAFAAIVVPSVVMLFSVAATEDEPRLEVERIGERTWLLRTASDNVVVALGADGPLVIGNGAASFDDDVRTELAKLDARRPECFVLTHEHRGAVSMPEEAFSIAHDATSETMTANGRGANLHFRSRLTLEAGDETLTCHFKGHGRTAGDLVAHLSTARVLAVGALVENHRHPTIRDDDRTELRGWIRVLRELARDFDGKEIVVVPASGPRGGIELLTDQAGYLQAVLDDMVSARRHGLSRDEAMRRGDALRERFSDRTGDGFDSLLELAYDAAGR
ncbi:MAG: hypothetical protein KDB80_12680 [Planctomycetes bacterium]|nr:hypothetical protein [Planctomycetota bacterium]